MLNDEVIARSVMAPPVTSAPPRARVQLPVSDQSTLFDRGFDVVGWLVLVDCFALSLAHLFVPSTTVLTAVLLAPLALLLNAAGGHYRHSVDPSVLDELPALAGRALTAGAVATIAAAVLAAPASQAGPAITAAAFLGVAVLGRAVGYPLLRRRRAVLGSGRPTIIVGGRPVGAQIAATLLEYPEYGMLPVGYVDDDGPTLPSDHTLPHLGRVDALPALLRRHRVCDVVVADAAQNDDNLRDVLRRCDRLPGEVYIVPRLHDLLGDGAGPAVRSQPLTRLRRAPHRSLSWRFKRGFDVVVASLGLVIFSPVFAACALAVYLEGGPGIIFRQERVGLDNRRFKIFKFRSLAPKDDTESQQRWSIVGDDGVGKVGSVLRAFSLDELPQLWNVVRGDMSLVGPRPERQFFVDQFSQTIPSYAARHRVAAGLTGWAQISGLRGDTDIAERARFDNYYIDNWSMWTDIKILLRTVGKVLGRSGG